MAVASRLIKRRIRSVANTRKITKAMELVAAAKMRKAVKQTLSARPYATSIKTMVDEVRRVIGDRPHPLLQRSGTSRKTMLVLVSSDRGLCGSFNAQMVKKAFEFLRTRSEDVLLITVGRRAELAARRSGRTITASFSALSDETNFDRARPIGDLIYQTFEKQEVDRVFVAFADFKSALSYIPTVIQLLPITPEANDSVVEARSPRSSEGQDDPAPTTTEEDQDKQEMEEPDILFEPHPSSVLDALLPRLIEARLYQTLLESSASEHSSRMMAMRSATDNASTMLEDLTFTFNQARQASITREISEISAGKAALE